MRQSTSVESNPTLEESAGWGECRRGKKTLDCRGAADRRMAGGCCRRLHDGWQAAKAGGELQAACRRHAWRLADVCCGLAKAGECFCPDCMLAHGWPGMQRHEKRYLRASKSEDRSLAEDTACSAAEKCSLHADDC
jgi:hypothetical protein